MAVEPTIWTIRAGTGADIGAVLALWRTASRPSATDDEDGIAQLLSHDPAALLVAEAGGELVGTLIAAWDGWRGSFYRLAVHPDRRRSGLAMSLLRAGESRLEALGAVRLSAIVSDEDPAAAAFWLAAGYESQPENTRFVRMLDGE